MAGFLYKISVKGPIRQTRTRRWPDPGQEGWADYSGVSRTSKRCDESPVDTIQDALQTVSSPFLDREVLLVLHQEGMLWYYGI